jgi:microcystin-dependent protein
MDRRYIILGILFATSCVLVGFYFVFSSAKSSTKTGKTMPAGKQQALNVDVVKGDNVLTAKNDGTIIARSLKDLLESAVPPGTITMWWGSISTIPSGWELCNGTNTIINGASITKPDFTGRFPFGVDSSIIKGATGGEKTVTLTTAQIPAHAHNFDEQYAIDCRDGNFTNKSESCWMSGPPKTRTLSTTSTGGGGAHNNMPPYIGVYFIIKVDV